MASYCIHGMKRKNGFGSDLYSKQRMGMADSMGITRSRVYTAMGMYIGNVSLHSHGSLIVKDRKMRTSLLLYLLSFQRQYLDIYHRSVVAVDSHVGDGIDDIHSFVGLTEYGVVTIEMWSSFCRLNDEELATIGIGSSVCHGEGSFDMCEFWNEFIFEFLSVDTLPSSSRRSRVSSLDHEVLDDTVKYC